VLPRSTEDVVAVMEVANRHRIPVVPRAGATGLADGAVPLHRGIVLDVKRMSRIGEVDLGTRTVRVQPGVNLRRLNDHLRPSGLLFPDDPSSYECAMLGGRIGTSGWSHLAGRFGHTRDLIVSMTVVLPTGEVVQVGEGGGPTIRKSSTGYALKQLLIGHQGTLGVTTEAVVELVPRPEREFAAAFGFGDFESAHAAMGQLARSGLATLSGVMMADDVRLDFVRREGALRDEPELAAVVTAVLCGTADEVEAGARRVLATGIAAGGRHMGDQWSHEDWVARHIPHIAPLHGTLPDGRHVPMTWHVQDAACPYPEVPRLREAWHEIVDRYARAEGIFDDWGISCYTNGSYKPWGELSTTIEVGIWEQALDDERWRAWVECEHELCMASVRCGGSLSCAHGSVREGSVRAMREELGEENLALMARIKHTLDPNDVMNPGKFGLEL
jgi:glycolate oxidase